MPCLLLLHVFVLTVVYLSMLVVFPKQNGNVKSHHPHGDKPACSWDDFEIIFFITKVAIMIKNENVKWFL